ncbi:ribokinase [Parashewanella tropica]|uniref:ribokinase n=1 Tax=Parashewanella tropica TaxID=2547970 RepID=UPI00105A6360|nr:ribokinase [Parashewanella tropica]
MSDAFFLGSINLDISLFVDTFPTLGQSKSAQDTFFSCGGKGANQAYACSKNSASTTLVSKVGNDAFADHLRVLLKQRTRQQTFLLESELHTALAHIFIQQSDAQNLIVSSAGANKDISVEEVQQFEEKIASANLLAIQFENNLAAVAKAIEIAKQANVWVLLDPAPFEPEMASVFQQVDVLTPNEFEASQISGANVHDGMSAHQAAQIIQKKYGISKVIITLGSTGVFAMDENRTYFSPAYQCAVRDTTGAGDAFNGAFIAHYIKGYNFFEAVEFANAYASTAVEGVGASYMPEPHLAKRRYLDRKNESKK